MKALIIAAIVLSSIAFVLNLIVGNMAMALVQLVLCCLNVYNYYMFRSE